MWEGVWHWTQREICQKGTNFLLLGIILQGEGISTFQKPINDRWTSCSLKTFTYSSICSEEPQVTKSCPAISFQFLSYSNPLVAHCFYIDYLKIFYHSLYQPHASLRSGWSFKASGLNFVFLNGDSSSAV
jgi:hypothetical protein